MAINELKSATSNTNSSHQKVRPKDILNIKTTLPSIVLAERFSIITLPFIKKMNGNRFQIQALEKLRDRLLPKLMSGDIKVI